MAVSCARYDWEKTNIQSLSKKSAPTLTAATLPRAAANCVLVIRETKSVSLLSRSTPRLLANDAGEGCGRGCGLLGRENESENLQQHKADGVVGAAGETLYEGRQAWASMMRNFIAAVMTVSKPPPSAASHMCQYSLRSWAM